MKQNIRFINFKFKIINRFRKCNIIFYTIPKFRSVKNTKYIYVLYTIVFNITNKCRTRDIGNQITYI